MEGDCEIECEELCYRAFQSTPSAWRETTFRNLWNCRSLQFQSTPSAWRETGGVIVYWYDTLNFNPLPPHGGRPCCIRSFTCSCVISIHSLRMEGDPFFIIFLPYPLKFQSTPSAWRETFCHFYHSFLIFYISIHSLRMEGDFPSCYHQRWHKVFQSTPSAWRETSGES